MIDSMYHCKSRSTNVLPWYAIAIIFVPDNVQYINISFTNHVVIQVYDWFGAVTMRLTSDLQHKYGNLYRNLRTFFSIRIKMYSSDNKVIVI